MWTTTASCGFSPRKHQTTRRLSTGSASHARVSRGPLLLSFPRPSSSSEDDRRDGEITGGAPCEKPQASCCCVRCSIRPIASQATLPSLSRGSPGEQDGSWSGRVPSNATTPHGQLEGSPARLPSISDADSKTYHTGGVSRCDRPRVKARQPTPDGPPSPPRSILSSGVWWWW